MYDFGGHGTGTAGSITSSGKQSYGIYTNSTKYHILGVAPGAKIVPIKALWWVMRSMDGSGLLDLTRKKINGSILEILE
ncbi:S8 family serine peptidase [Candidatus Nitrosotalea sp. FS]|uniref:S8 family serine peptidase n=1 Tax=Candidatus Nitrosotalea sp. FS TaxID=2341021 RepID=UPI0037432250